ncbi:hypothetical protein GCM10028792_35230 [Salinisphaera aquimarina]
MKNAGSRVMGRDRTRDWGRTNASLKLVLMGEVTVVADKRRMTARAYVLVFPVRGTRAHPCSEQSMDRTGNAAKVSNDTVI